MAHDKSDLTRTPIVTKDGVRSARWKNLSKDRSDEFNEAVLGAAALDTTLAVQVDLTDDREPQIMVRPEYLGDIDGVSQETLNEYGLGALNPRQVSVLTEAGMSIDEALTVADRPTQHFDQKQTTKAIKDELKTAFPDTKFSVTGSRGTGYGYLDARWQGGPTEAQVKEITGKYQSSYFDGWDDSNRTMNTTVAKVDGEWAPVRYTDKGVSHNRTADFNEVRSIEETLGEPNLRLSSNGGYQHCSSCGDTMDHGGLAYTSDYDTRGIGQCSKSCHAVALEAVGVTAEQLGGTAPQPPPKSSFKSFAEAKRAAVPGTRISMTTEFRPGNKPLDEHDWSGTIEKVNSTGVWIARDDKPEGSRLQRVSWPETSSVSMVGGANTFRSSNWSGEASYQIGEAA